MGQSRLSNYEETSNRRMKLVEDETISNQEKLILLEDAQQQQIQKSIYMESLGARVNKLDEMRQQSEAKAKDEVDATMSHSTRLIKSLQSEFDERVNVLEKHVMSEQKFLSQEVSQELNTIKSKTDSFHAKLDENSSSLTAKIGIIESNFSQRINEFDKNVITQLQKIESESKLNTEKIENQIQESQFIHAEKVQYVESLESKVKQMNEDQKRQEVEA